MIQRILTRVRRELGQGVDLPLIGLRVGITVGRSARTRSAEHGVLRRTVHRLVTLFPELSRWSHPAIDADLETCAAALDFIHDYLPLFYESARETKLRSLLVRLRARTKDEGYKRQLTLEIAKSDARSGVTERATVLLREPPTTAEDRELIAKLSADIDVFERRYDARAGLISSRELWRSMPGDVRGQSLVAYFKANRESLRDKSILHVGPEPALRQWIEREAAGLGVRYVTLDPFSTSVDLREDLTRVDVEDRTFDLVICHRVLEHILDDAAALREIHRLLKPGGVLNLSVPQSVNLDVTNEWVIPDHSHDHHVRQYGNDLDERLRKAGFEVAVDRFLLDRTKEQHLAEATFPLRMYVCTKPALARVQAERVSGGAELTAARSVE